MKDLKRFVRFLSRSDTHYQTISTCETLVIYLFSADIHQVSPYNIFNVLEGLKTYGCCLEGR